LPHGRGAQSPGGTIKEIARRGRVAKIGKSHITRIRARGEERNARPRLSLAAILCSQPDKQEEGFTLAREILQSTRKQ
jgi:hypothetical protein